MKELTEKMEMYLKTIWELESVGGAAKAADIASRMDVRMATVTSALQRLTDHGLIHYRPYSTISLTESGRDAALEIQKKYSTIQDFLVNVLEIDPPTASIDACAMEHYISEVALERITKFIEYYNSCPNEQKQWKEHLGYICRSGLLKEDCENCGKLRMLKESAGGASDLLG